MLRVRNKFADGMNEEERGADVRAREGTDDEESAATRELQRGNVSRALAQERFFLQSRVRLRPHGQKIERTDEPNRDSM